MQKDEHGIPLPGAVLLDEDGDTMPFGPHKGTKMQDVPKHYLLELWNTGFHLKVGDNDEALEGALARYIKNNMVTIASSPKNAFTVPHNETVPPEFRADTPPKGAPGAPGTPEEGNVGKRVPVGLHMGDKGQLSERSPHDKTPHAKATE